tara:strand:+ start:1481 stop:2650 length:1170 start_codon:yes stop_codon:yes gene_type:complete
MSDKAKIEEKLKAITANVAKCNMTQVGLKLQINSKKNKLGGGVYGTAYKAYASNGKTVPFVVKEMKKRNITDQESRIEYATTRVLRNSIPPFAKERIQRSYGFQICDKSEYLFSNLIKGVALGDFIPDSGIQMASIITQVLYTLYIINSKIPSFRHHDLHQNNILIVKDDKKDLTIKISGKDYKFNNGGVKAVIIDFGMATVTGVNNPKINQGGLKYAGINRTSKSIYDAHFFLNSVYLSAPGLKQQIRDQKIKESITRVERFIEKHFDKKFLVAEPTNLIQGGRLTIPAQNQINIKLIDIIKNIDLIPLQQNSPRLPPPRNNRKPENARNIKNVYKKLVSHIKANANAKPKPKLLNTISNMGILVAEAAARREKAKPKNTFGGYPYKN